MSKIEIIRSYYEANMGKNLPDYSVLGWESEEAQHLRFDVLIDNLDLHGKHILDVGCGLGNLAEYLSSRGIKVKYTGVDILPTMIEQAKQKGMNASFYCIDIFNESFFEKNIFDIVYASGIFNLNLGNNKDFLINALTRFFELSGKIVVFNLLHHCSPNKEDIYYYFDPYEVEDILTGQFSDSFNKLQIIEGYLQNDFAVICHK